MICERICLNPDPTLIGPRFDRFDRLTAPRSSSGYFEVG